MSKTFLKERKKDQLIKANLLDNRVEAQITLCNPHRTERAELLHSAPHNIVFISQLAQMFTLILGCGKSKNLIIVVKPLFL